MARLYYSAAPRRLGGMPYIAGRNNHGSNTYTVTTLSQGSSQQDLAPSADFPPFAVNHEVLEAVEAQLAGFSGVEWEVYDLTRQVRATILDATGSPITGNVDDYDPAGWADGPHDVLVVAITGLGATLRGLTGGRPGRRFEIVNGTGSVLGLSLANDNANSAAANRFLVPGLAGTLPITAGASARGIYVGGSINRWRALG